MNLKHASNALVISLVLGLGHIGLTQAQDPATDGPEPAAAKTNTSKGPLPLDELRTFTRVFESIRTGHVEEVDDATLLEYAIKGMLQELDPHSAYLDKDNFKQLKESTTGHYGGLGIEVGNSEDGFVKVIAPIDDTPAKKAGVEAGDLITRIDGVKIKGKTLAEAIEMMRGDKGEKITLRIIREGKDEALTFTIVRDHIKIRSVRSRIIDQLYAYIRIAQFQAPTGDDFVAELKKVQRENPGLKGLIIDLRNNPGGVLQASVKVADALLEEGRIVYTEGRVAGSNAEFDAQPGDDSNGLPIVVLINGGSASASEIVAGALQDHKRALLIGTKSFGKGSVQSVIPLSETKAIKLTTSLYFTPNGRSIQAQGIAPDIIVERAKITAIKPRMALTEADLDGHLGNAKGGKESKAKDRKQDQLSSRKLLERDNQLYEAVVILKGLGILAPAVEKTAAMEADQ